MKKILVDLYKVGDLYSGIGQFSAQFADYLSQEYCYEFDFHFLVPRNHKHTYSPLIKVIEVNPILRWWKASHEQYDLWHSLYQFPTYSPPASFKQLLTIHNLNFLEDKKEGEKQKYLQKLAKDIYKADFVSTISNYTKSQIEENIQMQGKTIEVIRNGVNSLTEHKISKPDFLPEGKYFFSISLFKPKKNFDALLPMMKHFPNTKLILAGNHDNTYGVEMKNKIKTLGLESQVVLPGIISDTEKAALYRGCEAFLFPLLAQGLGLPVIEAMQFGKPVFLSNLTSLPEIGGKVAHFFDDFEANSMAQVIKKGLYNYYHNEEGMAAEIRAHATRFTWKESMQKYISLYKQITRED